MGVGWQKETKACEAAGGGPEQRHVLSVVLGWTLRLLQWTPRSTGPALQLLGRLVTKFEKHQHTGVKGGAASGES